MFVFLKYKISNTKQGGFLMDKLIGKISEIEASASSIMDSVNPVSYTHLDVYKRQD